MAQSTILSTDTIREALLTKVNANDTELYAIKAEVEAARGVESDLDTRLDIFETAIASLAAGSGIIVSTNDATVGNLESKLIAGVGVSFATNNDGGDETRTITAGTVKATSADTSPSYLSAKLYAGANVLIEEYDDSGTAKVKISVPSIYLEDEFNDYFKKRFLL